MPRGTYPYYKNLTVYNDNPGLEEQRKETLKEYRTTRQNNHLCRAGVQPMELPRMKNMGFITHFVETLLDDVDLRQKIYLFLKKRGI